MGGTVRVLLLGLVACGPGDKPGDTAAGTTPAGTAPTGTTPAGTTPAGTPTGTGTGTTGGGTTPTTPVEDCGNGVDDDDDGLVDCDDPDCLATCDADGDGFFPPEDCDDEDGSRYPGATEICGDGIDQDCDGADAACVRMFVADGRGGRDRKVPPLLHEVDLEAGTVTPLGELPDTVTGLTWVGREDLLAVTSSFGNPARVFAVAVDPLTLEERYTADTGHWSGFAWNPVDGALYFWQEGDDALFALDLDTGAVDGPLMAAGSSGSCLAIDADGAMYRLSGPNLFVIDPGSGMELALGAVAGLPSGYNGQGCAFGDGLLYVAPFSATDPDFGDRILYAVDPVAATATSTGIVLPEHTDALGAWPP